VWAAFRVRPPYMSAILALITMVTLASVLESGLFDTTPAFILFWVIVLITHRVPEDLPEDQTTR
jgi:hypothetical protein